MFCASNTFETVIPMVGAAMFSIATPIFKYRVLIDNWIIKTALCEVALCEVAFSETNNIPIGTSFLIWDNFKIALQDIGIILKCFVIFLG